MPDDDSDHQKRMKSIANLHDLSIEIVHAFELAVQEMVDSPHKQRCLVLLSKIDREVLDVEAEID